MFDRRIAIAAVSGLFSSVQAGIVIHVDDDICPGPGDGSELNPYCRIQDAIDAAFDGDDVVVAPGIYHEQIDLHGKSIALRSIMGAAATTIKLPDSAGPSDPVVTFASGEGSGTIIDGFTITETQPRSGFGASIAGASPTILNCVFRDLFRGIDSSGGKPVISHCTLIDNGGGAFGASAAGISIDGGRVADCGFFGNQVFEVFFAGAMLVSGDVVVVNCIFSGNFGGQAGGAILVSGGAPVITACTFSSNQTAAGSPGAGIVNTSTAAQIADCIFWNNSSGGFLFDEVFQIQSAAGASINHNCIMNLSGLAGNGNIGLNPLFALELGLDGQAGTGDEDLRLTNGSPCIDAGNNAGVPTDVTTDLDGSPRFLDVPETPDIGLGEPPIVDMGAYESLGGGCLALTGQETLCHPDGTTFTLNVEGISTCTGDTVTATFTGTGGAVGADLCFTMMVNGDGGGFCCATQICVPVPDCSAATGDLDGNGLIGVQDLILLLGQFGQCQSSCPADMDHDGAIGVTDLLILLANWS